MVLALGEASETVRNNMVSYEHRELRRTIQNLSSEPETVEAWEVWSQNLAGLLHHNATEGEDVIIHASDRRICITSAVVDESRISLLSKEGLMRWGPMVSSCSSYSLGSCSGDVSVSRDSYSLGEIAAQPLVFRRSLPDSDVYSIEILQEFTHLAGTVWRSEKMRFVVLTRAVILNR